jgi:hypothetical protein
MPEIFLITVEAARRTDMGLILLPPLPGRKHHYDKVERIKVETPTQTVLECDAMFGSHLSFVPSKSFYIITVPSVEECNIPLGSKIWLLHKTEEQLALPPFTKEAKEKSIALINTLEKSLPADVREELLEHLRNMKTDENVDEE